MTLMTLPNRLEATIRKMEQRGAEVSRKIDDAVNCVESSADDFDLDDPSVVRHVEEMRDAVAAARAPNGTPPNGSAAPTVALPRARLIRRAQRPPRG